MAVYPKEGMMVNQIEIVLLRARGDSKNGLFTH